MIIIVCLDDKNGMMFNKRRQSRDSAVIKRICCKADGSALWINSYSAQLFEKYAGNIKTDDNFLNKAAKGEYCFVENTSVSEFEACAEQIIVYRWNRTYPSDFKLDISLSDGKWKLESTCDFGGSSHEKITEEIYVK